MKTVVVNPLCLSLYKNQECHTGPKLLTW